MPNKMGFTFACMALILDNFKDHHQVKDNTAVVDLIKSADQNDKIDDLDQASTIAIKKTLLKNPFDYINALQAITEQYPTDLTTLWIKEEDRQLIQKIISSHGITSNSVSSLSLAASIVFDLVDIVIKHDEILAN